MLLQLKDGVKLKDLQPQAVLMLMIVGSCYSRLDPEYVVTVTSGNDGKHSDKSLHYKGFAFDFRTKNFNEDKHVLVSMIRQALGAEFDVVLEMEGEPQEHLHVEWDPR